MKPEPIIIGLTGSIGMGKSTAAAMLVDLGCVVHSADAVVHRLLAVGGKAVTKVARVFPQAKANHAIDRRILGQLVFGKPRALRRLEKILHPLVRSEERKIINAARYVGKKFVVLDIPLLFETGGEKRCDHVIVVTATVAIQKQRVLARAGMTTTKLRAIMRQQLPDKTKRQKADFVVRSDRGRAAMRRRLKTVLQKITLTAKA
jgi:dephospho-CoA kinase